MGIGPPETQFEVGLCNHAVDIHRHTVR